MLVFFPRSGFLCTDSSRAPLHTSHPFVQSCVIFFFFFWHLMSYSRECLPLSRGSFLLHCLISLFPNSHSHNSLLLGFFFFYETCYDMECVRAYITFYLHKYRRGTHSRNGLAGARGTCTCHFLFGTHSSPVTLPILA